MPKEKILTLTKKDFKITTFKAGGPGGQHQNKTDSGVRILHTESGAVSESRSERSQHMNKKLALKRLTKSNKFKVWLARKVFEITSGKTIEERVDEAMLEKNLKIEIKNEKNKWVEYDNSIS